MEEVEEKVEKEHYPETLNAYFESNPVVYLRAGVLLQQATYVCSNLGQFCGRVAISYRTLDLNIHAAHVGVVLCFMKYHSTFLFKTLIDLVVYDMPGRKKRYMLIYLLLSVKYNARFTIRTQVSDLIPSASVAETYKNANWLEREA